MSIKKINNLLSKSKYILSIVWFYRIFIKKNNKRLIDAINSIQINNESLLSLIDDNDILIDIGSHGGSWSFYLSKLVPKGKVICFDALPIYASSLKILSFLTRKKNIDCYNYAIQDKVSKMRLTWLDQKGDRLTGMTRISVKADKKPLTLIVKGITLDSFFSDFEYKNRIIKFIKIDIEGAELLALKGSIKIIEKFKPIIIIEVCINHLKKYDINIKSIYSFFDKIGYKANSTLQKLENFKYISLENPDFNDDIIFIPKFLKF